MPGPDLGAHGIRDAELLATDALVTSNVLCQGEEVWDSLGCVFVSEDGEEDSVH